MATSQNNKINISARSTPSYSFRSKTTIPDCCYKIFDCLPPKYKPLPTPLLRRAREDGWKIIRNNIFPLINESAEDVWIITQLIVALAILGFSIGLVARGNKTIYVRLAIASVFVSWEIFYALFRVAHRCTYYCKFLNSDEYIVRLEAARPNESHAEEAVPPKNIDDPAAITPADVNIGRPTNIDDAEFITPAL